MSPDRPEMQNEEPSTRVTVPDPDESETLEAYGARLAQELEAMIQSLGPDTVIAFVAETVGGDAGGPIQRGRCARRAVVRI